MIPSSGPSLCVPVEKCLGFNLGNMYNLLNDFASFLIFSLPYAIALISMCSLLKSREHVHHLLSQMGRIDKASRWLISAVYEKGVGPREFVFL